MISIIVCNHDYSQFIPVLMQAYNKHPFDKDEVEMIIVDDNSTKDNFLSYLRLSMILVEPWFKVRAFETHNNITKNNVLPDNVGVRQCKGDIIILNPIDVVPCTDVLPIIYERHKEVPNLYLYPSFFLSFGGWVKGYDKWQVTTCGSSMRKETYELLGGQDERFIGHCNSDVNFVVRIQQGPFAFVKDERLIYAHLHDVFCNGVCPGVEPPALGGHKANVDKAWGQIDTLEEINLQELIRKEDVK